MRGRVLLFLLCLTLLGAAGVWAAQAQQAAATAAPAATPATPAAPETPATPAAPAAPNAAAPNAIVLPDGPGKDLVAYACTQCHSLQRVVTTHESQAVWESIVEEMLDNGADLSDADVPVVVSYLAKNFGKPAAGATAVPAEGAAPSASAGSTNSTAAGDSAASTGSAAAPGAETAAGGASGAPAGSPAAALAINQASAADIAKALDISPALATAITSWRTQHGPFAGLPDLARVPGLDPKLVASWKGRIVF